MTEVTESSVAAANRAQALANETCVAYCIYKARNGKWIVARHDTIAYTHQHLRPEVFEPKLNG